MPKHLFKKLSPHPDVIKTNKHLGWLGEHLSLPRLWHFNRRNIPPAFAIGLFAMWIPFPGQSVLAAVLAVLFRANLPISVALVFVTNPLTGPPMFYFAYRVGAWLLSQEPVPHFEMSMEWLENMLVQTWEPVLLGLTVVATASAILGYYGVILFWRMHILQRLKERRERKYLPHRRRVHPQDPDEPKP